MLFRRSLRFAAVSARTCTWTADLRMLMPEPPKGLVRLPLPLPVVLRTLNQGDVPIGRVESVETFGRQILSYGRLTPGVNQDWHAIELHLGREFIVPIFDWIDVEEMPNRRQRVWNWSITGFEVTRHPLWDDLPACRVKQSKPSW